MEIEDDLNTASRQYIINALKLHILAPSFINIIKHLIKDISNSLSSSLFSFSNKKAISILSIMKIIQAICYIMPCQHLL